MWDPRVQETPCLGRFTPPEEQSRLSSQNFEGMKGTTTVVEGSGSHDARWPKSFKILESALKFRASVDSEQRELLGVKCAGPSGFGPPV